jgi:hypothetical protein
MIGLGAHAYANQTVPYGTALLGGPVPGTSCQATIALSLWDESHSPFEGPRIKLGQTIPNSPHLCAIQPWAMVPGPSGQGPFRGNKEAKIRLIYTPFAPVSVRQRFAWQRIKLHGRTLLAPSLAVLPLALTLTLTLTTVPGNNLSVSTSQSSKLI